MLGGRPNWATMTAIAGAESSYKHAIQKRATLCQKTGWGIGRSRLAISVPSIAVDLALLDWSPTRAQRGQVATQVTGAWTTWSNGVYRNTSMAAGLRSCPDT